MVMDDLIVQMHYGVMHPMFREQLYAAPSGYSYRSCHPYLQVNDEGPKRIAQNARHFAHGRRAAERLAVRTLSRVGYVHRVQARTMRGATLIHSCERLLLKSPLPYVLDFEHALLFVLYQRLALDRPWARTWLMRALKDERLRVLLPWTNFAQQSLLTILGQSNIEWLRPKIEVVYPAIRPAVAHARKRSQGPFRCLFVGTAFYEKGAVETIRAIHRVAAAHAVRLDLVSYAPPRWATRLADDKLVTYHKSGEADIRALYNQADALVFPSHMDTFGFVILEAMAHGIPVIAPAHPPFDEIVADGASGLLFAAENQLFDKDTTCRFAKTLPPPRRFQRELSAPSDHYVDGIATAIARLAEDQDLYRHLAEGAYQSVCNGTFSIDARRRALADVYAAALNEADTTPHIDRTLA